MNKILINYAIPLSNRTKEIYRMLRTNIEFTGVENKTIVITSCSPGDGKSTIAYQLARAMADADKKTLFIDADMRKSTMSKRLAMEEGLTGLSHILAGQNELKDGVYTTNIPNFYVMPPGIFPTNPTELLGKKRFEKVILEVRNKLDYVIIDTPPIGSVIDAAVVAKHCDASLLVISANKNSRREEWFAAEQMKLANPNVLGAVLNRAEVKNKGFYGSKYYAYYEGENRKKR